MLMIFNQGMQSNYPQFKGFRGVPLAVVVCRLLTRVGRGEFSRAEGFFFLCGH